MKINTRMNDQPVVVDAAVWTVACCGPRGIESYSVWFSSEEAHAYAKQGSLTVPDPFRLIVFDPNEQYEGTYQHGERTSPFEVRP